MQWILDNIAAFVISCTVILLLAVLSLTGQKASIEAVQYSTARTASVTLTEVLEQDLMNIGAGRLAIVFGDIVIEKNGPTPYVEFLTRDNRADPNPVTVRYSWVESGTINARGTQIPAYQVTRHVDGQAVPITGNTVTSFDITFKRRVLGDWTPVTTAEAPQSSRVDVRLTLASPLETGEIVEETLWERQIIPVNLRRDGGSIRLTS
jgi:hypothetical protein